MFSELFSAVALKGEKESWAGLSSRHSDIGSSSQEKVQGHPRQSRTAYFECSAGSCALLCSQKPPLCAYY